ncbi:hypothetical protein [Brevundimonas sp.]|uniref:hypothetical protein n=1 Tax=Brevundimonas sp. TaxID=1871086 RepID=UPI00344BF15C
MVGKPLQGRHAELRAEEDFAVNQKVEGEIEAIMWQLQTAISRRLESRGASHRPQTGQNIRRSSRQPKQSGSGRSGRPERGVHCLFSRRTAGRRVMSKAPIC